MPLKLSLAWCQVDPCFTRRTSNHPPPWNESSQKNLGAGTTNQRVSRNEAPQEKEDVSPKHECKKSTMVNKTKSKKCSSAKLLPYDICRSCEQTRYHLLAAARLRNLRFPPRTYRRVGAWANQCGKKHHSAYTVSTVQCVLKWVWRCLWGRSMQKLSLTQKYADLRPHQRVRTMLARLSQNQRIMKSVTKQSANTHVCGQRSKRITIRTK